MFDFGDDLHIDETGCTDERCGYFRSRLYFMCTCDVENLDKSNFCCVFVYFAIAPLLAANVNSVRHCLPVVSIKISNIVTFNLLFQKIPSAASTVSGMALIGMTFLYRRR
jgi:hypothetical protein